MLTSIRRHFLAAAAIFAAWPARAQTPAPATAAPSPAAGPDAAAQPGADPFSPPGVRVEVTTKLGAFTVEMADAQAPITSANFLRYVDRKLFDGSSFYRASRTPNYPQLGVIQGGLQNDPKKLLKPIAHESTTKTGLRHKDGTISLARNAPGTATADFFICVGDAGYLDAHPDAPGDNQGFAAFGQVVDGMDVVKAILALPTDGPARNPVMKGQMLTTPLIITRMRRLKTA